MGSYPVPTYHFFFPAIDRSQALVPGLLKMCIPSQSLEGEPQIGNDSNKAFKASTDSWLTIQFTLCSTVLLLLMYKLVNP